MRDSSEEIECHRYVEPPPGPRMSRAALRAGRASSVLLASSTAGLAWTFPTIRGPTVSWNSSDGFSACRLRVSLFASSTLARMSAIGRQPCWPRPGKAGRLDNLDLHAFEPSAYTFALLEETLKDQPARLRRCAVGDHTGSATLYVTGAGAGTNSLHKPGNLGVHATEEVPVITLAAYANDAGLNDITLVKIDTEGHDLSVLRGARKLFAEQRIAVVQFEYNYRWIFARSFLLDAFGLLSQFGYHLGKLTPVGVEFYPNWDPDLETFIEGNYVACSAPTAPLLPSITWWKAAGGP